MAERNRFGTLLASVATAVASFTGTVEAQQSTPPSIPTPNVVVNGAGSVTHFIIIKDPQKLKDAADLFYSNAPGANNFDVNNASTINRSAVKQSIDNIGGQKFYSFSVDDTSGTYYWGDIKGKVDSQGRLTVPKVSYNSDPAIVRQNLDAYTQNIGNLVSFVGQVDKLSKDPVTAEKKWFKDVKSYIGQSQVFAFNGSGFVKQNGELEVSGVKAISGFSDVYSALLNENNRVLADSLRFRANTTTRTTDPRTNTGNNTVITAPTTTIPTVAATQFNDPVAAMVAMNNGGTVVDKNGVTHNYPGFANAAKAYQQFAAAFKGTDIAQTLEEFKVNRTNELQGLKYGTVTAKVIMENELFALAAQWAAQPKAQDLYKNDATKLAALQSLAAFADYSKADPKLGLRDPAQPKAGYNSQYTGDKDAFDQMRGNDEWNNAFSRAVSQKPQAAAPAAAPATVDPSVVAATNALAHIDSSSTQAAVPRSLVEQLKANSAAMAKIDLVKLNGDIVKVRSNVKDLYENVIAKNKNKDFYPYARALFKAMQEKEIPNTEINGVRTPNDFQQVVDWTMDWAYKNPTDAFAKHIAGDVASYNAAQSGKAEYTRLSGEQAKITAQMQGGNQLSK